METRLTPREPEPSARSISIPIELVVTGSGNVIPGTVPGTVPFADIRGAGGFYIYVQVVLSGRAAQSHIQIEENMGRGCALVAGDRGVCMYSFSEESRIEERRGRAVGAGGEQVDVGGLVVGDGYLR